MNENLKKANKVKINTIIKNLKKRNMNGHYCETREDAVSTIIKLIGKDEEISWGGSMTLDEIGIKDALKIGEYNVLDVMKSDKNGPTPLELRRKALSSDVFLSSLNAITMDGEMVNIDGTGNRVAAMIFGPQKVIVIAGYNKIVRDIVDAENRIKSDACPANCIRLNKKTPCAKTGECVDCLIPGETVCNYKVVTRFSPDKDRMHIILVNESLGY